MEIFSKNIRDHSFHAESQLSIQIGENPLLVFWEQLFDVDFIPVIPLLFLLQIYRFSPLHPLYLSLTTVQSHYKKLLNFGPLLQNRLAQQVYLLCLYFQFFFLFLYVEKFQFQRLQIPFTFLLVFRKTFLFLCHFLRNRHLQVFKLVFVGLDFGLLQRAHCLVLFEFFLIECDIDFELFSFIDDLVSFLFEFLQFGLELVEFLFELDVLVFVGLKLGSDFIDGVRRGCFVSDVELMVETGLKLAVLLHLEGFFFIEAIVLLVLLVDVVFGNGVDFGDILSFEVFELFEFFVFGFELLYFFIDLESFGLVQGLDGFAQFFLFLFGLLGEAGVVFADGVNEIFVFLYFMSVKGVAFAHSPQDDFPFLLFLVVN